MSKEKFRDLASGLDEFDTSLMYDDIERIREIEEAEEKDQNNKLSFAGLMALIAGTALLVITIAGSLFPANILEFLRVFMQIAGFGALGYGFYKMLKLVFREKELNFPALNVYRKTKPAAATAGAATQEKTTDTDTFSSAQNRNYSRKPRTYNNNRRELRRSRTNRVFSGVAGGLAEYFGVSSALLRFAFILSIFATSGSSIFLYLLLSIILPPNYDDYREARQRKRSRYSDDFAN
jgi:phage shock protein C